MCGNCGHSYSVPSSYRAHGQIHLYCKKPNYFVEVCRLKAHRQQFHKIDQSRRPPSPANTEPTTPAGFEHITFESITIADVSNGESNPCQDKVSVSVNLKLPQTTNTTTNLKAKLGTGAQGNILPMRIYRQVYPHHFNNHGNLKPS